MLGKIGFALFISVLSTQTASAQTGDTGQWKAEFSTCLALSQSDKRLICLDNVSRRFVEASSAGAIAVVDRKAQAQADRQGFGVRPDAASPLAKDDKSVDTIDARVVRVAALPYDRLLIEIEGGAKWRTTEAWTGQPPRQGDTLSIRRGGLGSFVVRTASGRAARALRVR